MTSQAAASTRRALFVTMLIVAFALPVQAFAADSAATILARTPAGGPTLDLLIGARPGRASGVRSLTLALGTHDRGTVPGMAVRRLRVPASAAATLIRTLSADPSVAYVEADAPANATLIPNDPLYLHGYEPGLDEIGMPAAWDISTGASGPVIAVVDTGGDAPHEDLGGRVLPGYDFANGDSDPTDDNGHGTHVAGIIAATGNNGIGGAGVCWGCRILPVKVLAANGSGWYSTVAAGIVWAADHGAQVINLSLGGSAASDTLAQAVAYAESKGIIVVAAAGNNGVTTRFYPAALPGVIAVAAAAPSSLDPAADIPYLYPWSDFGSDWVSVAAPGCTESTWPGNAYQSDCGTSMAAPFVSGSFGLLLDTEPAASTTDVTNALLGTAGPVLRDMTADGFIHTDLALLALISGDIPAPVPLP
ncbi:MAG: S8 family serine peptidase, partial [Acidimicrobiales bacterium]